MNDDAFTDMARKELTPEGWRAYAPIVRGPAFALLGLVLLGLCAVPYVLYRKARAYLPYD